MTGCTSAWRGLRCGALLVAVLLLAGCGSGSWSSLGTSGGSTRALSPIQRLVPFSDQWAPALPRFMDILNTPYLAAFQSSAAFPNGVIELQYETASRVPYFTGQIRGSGLKPNFCYQMKLMGKPGTLTNGLWRGGTADTATNQAILQAARWWNYKTEDSAFTTTTAATVLNSTDYKQGWVPGYTYFGYFLTDQTGAIRCTDLAQQDSAGWVAIAGNRCFHITGRTGQSIGQNTTPVTYSVVQDGAVYGGNLGSGTVDLWYEKEPDNPMTFNLPQGTHDVVLMVTEESFHNNLGGGTTGPAGGYWDTVWVSDWTTGTSPKTGQRWIGAHGSAIHFSTTSPATTLTVPTVAVTLASSGRKWVATAKVTVTDGTGAPVSGVTVKGQWSGTYSASISATTLASGVATVTTPSRSASSGNVFRFDITGLTKTGYVWDGTAAGGSVTVR